MTTARSQTDQRARALAGLRVLGLSRIVAGPSATPLPADPGAEVVKIERPREGAHSLSADRVKRSVAVNIADPCGQGVVQALAARVDILVENFSPGDLDRHGLDDAILSTTNP